MEFPWVCPECRSLNFVEMNILTEIPIDRVKREAGYTCEGCGKFQRLFLTTNSLNDATEKLKKMSVTHKNFRFHFAKTLKKAIGIQGK